MDKNNGLKTKQFKLAKSSYVQAAIDFHSKGSMTIPKMQDYLKVLYVIRNNRKARSGTRS